MKTTPQALKILVALAVNLRNSARGVREKQAYLKTAKDFLNAQRMDEQARMMHHALYNGFFIAKKAAGRK